MIDVFYIYICLSSLCNAITINHMGMGDTITNNCEVTVSFHTVTVTTGTRYFYALKSYGALLMLKRKSLQEFLHGTTFDSNNHISRT
jgi:hypothetical protein